MKIKQIIPTIALLFLTLLIKAQNKHDYMYIEYSTGDFYAIAISVNGKEYKKEKADFSIHEKSGFNANPFLLKVKEYESNGWEVMTLNMQLKGGGEVYFAYLRKESSDKK